MSVLPGADWQPIAICAIWSVACGCGYLGLPILVGFWPDEAEVLKDDRMRAAIGADYYTSSLHDAVEACLEAAYNSDAMSRTTSRGAVDEHALLCRRTEN